MPTFPDSHTNQPTAAPSDDELRVRVCADDSTAYTILYKRYVQGLLRFALTLVGSIDVAEDVVQDVMIVLWDRRADLGPHIDLRPYLYGAVRRRAMHVLRHTSVTDRAAQHLLPLDVAGLGDGSTPPAPDDATSAAQLDEAVHALLMRLSERERTILTLRFEGLSYTDIAIAIGASPEATQKQGRRALERLRILLDRFREE
jgi:RNA polymerase sigma-70 factor (ECF subfamily)